MLTYSCRDKMDIIFRNYHINFLCENCCIFIKISLKYLCKGTADTLSVRFQVMAWCWMVKKPLSESIMTEISGVAMPQWLNCNTEQVGHSIWYDRLCSMLLQVMAWCLMAPSHYLNRYWPINISEVLCYPCDSSFNGNDHDTSDSDLVKQWAVILI